ncbi:MAG: hypothetical protein ACKV2T_34635 [Kofleriaceae bacterium]
MLTKTGLALLAMTATAMAQPKPALTAPKPAPAKPKPDAPAPASIKPPDPAPQPPKPDGKPIRVNLPVIEVLDPSGTMTEPFVRSAIVKVEPALLKCAEVAKWKSTAFAWIVTDWRGKVSKLELAVDSAAVQKCLTTVLKSIVVQNAQVRATAFVKLQVGLAASNDPLDTME